MGLSKECSRITLDQFSQVIMTFTNVHEDQEIQKQKASSFS